MRIKKVYRVLSFKQSPWLKLYIDFNTRQRTTVKNEFEKNFIKLINNSKLMENLRHMRQVDLFNTSIKLS